MFLFFENKYLFVFAFAQRIQLELIKVLHFLSRGWLGGKRGFMHVIWTEVCPDWCIWIFNRDTKETYKINFKK